MATARADHWWSMDGAHMNRRIFLGLTILSIIPGCGGRMRGDLAFGLGCFYFGKDSPGFASLNSKESGGEWCTL